MSADASPPPARGRRIPIAAAAPAPLRAISPRWLVAAPHRLFFFLAMLGLIGVSLWWLAQIIARWAGVPLPVALPPSWIHGWSMAHGFLPLVMFGFLFTAGPRWLDVAAPPARALVVPGAGALAGVALVLLGGHLDFVVAAAGVLLVAAAWSALLARFLGLYRASRVADRLHARVIFASFACGLLAQPVFAVGLIRQSVEWVHAAAMIAIWLFLAPVYVTAAHRLIPFFTAGVVQGLVPWKPRWLLAALLGLVVAYGLLPVLAAVGSQMPIAATRLVVAAGGAGLVFVVAWRWGLLRSLRDRLLAMLHLGFAWLGIALALYAWNDATELLAAPWAAVGLAPMHALTMGFFGGVAFAMVTRVTAGHGGRRLAADRWTWALFWTLQAAVGLRLLVDVWPAERWLTPLAITLWCAAWLPWALRNALVYLQPRADRQPG